MSQYLVPAFIENTKTINMADPDTLIKAKIHYFAREKYYHSMQVDIPYGPYLCTRYVLTVRTLAITAFEL